MNDIQKAIDEAKQPLPIAILKDTSSVIGYTFTYEQLKSLLEQVAKDAHKSGAERVKKGRYVSPDEYWEDLNLTFNED